MSTLLYNRILYLKLSTKEECGQNHPFCQRGLCAAILYVIPKV